ncbi:MAG: hypothetical protein QNJ02_16685 [Desulfobacterales bacterium]|nr:hypothetical protein [Desulfobacterales bacterium]
MVSKPLITFKSKAEADEKAEHIQKYVSILKKPATPLLGVRRGFKATSNNNLTLIQKVDRIIAARAGIAMSVQIRSTT